jgi:PASTA domain
VRGLAALLGAVVVAAAAAAWYFATKDESSPPQPLAAPTGYAELNHAPGPATKPVVSSALRSPGLQTTVPDTLGFSERQATYALEAGGFRVRVMTHAVASASERGIVVQQLPRAGVTRRVGWTVTIVVGE